MRFGVRLGVDVGKARIGVARCDAHAMLSTPLETIARERSGSADLERLTELAKEYEAIEIVVGLPLGLGGHRTPSTEDAELFATQLVTALHEANPKGDVPQVRLVDERLSTVSAQSQLFAAGRNTKRSRGVIDQAAAVVILSHALDIERAQGIAPGTVVEPAPLSQSAAVKRESETE